MLNTALYLARTKLDPDGIQGCNFCHQQHRRGQYLSRDHRVLVYCTEPGDLEAYPLPDTVAEQVTPEQAIAQGRENYDGVATDCLHTAFTRECAASALKAQALPGAFQTQEVAHGT